MPTHIQIKREMYGGSCIQDGSREVFQKLQIGPRFKLGFPNEIDNIPATCNSLCRER